MAKNNTATPSGADSECNTAEWVSMEFTEAHE